jgi:hypothetical protein
MNKTYSYIKILSRQRSLVWTKFFIAVLVLSFASCKKDNEVGIDVQPEEDIIGLYTTDTLTLITSTVIEDSLRTDETPTVVLGTSQEPLFGESKCGVFSQFSIPNNQQSIDFTPGTTVAIFDSAVLMLAYEFDFYGDTSQAQTFNVYQMTDQIYKDSVYYSNSPKNYYPQAIGTKTFLPRPRTSVRVITDTDDSLAPHLRIPIDYNWAQQIFAQGNGSTGGPLGDNNLWAAYMNGLYIEAGATGSSLLYFNMLDSLTGLRLYYHNSEGDTTSFTFIVNSTTPFYSYYKHNYASSIVGGELNNTMTSSVYVQSNAGVKTKVQFPTLNAWYDNLGFEAAINKAELVIFGIPDPVPDQYPLNTRLLATTIDEDGKEHLMIDFFEGSSYFGGILNTTTSVYKINMARYFQSMLTGTQVNNGIYLKEIFGTENGRRSVLGSGNGSATPGYKMYLRITYTRIN